MPAAGKNAAVAGRLTPAGVPGRLLSATWVRAAQLTPADDPQHCCRALRQLPMVHAVRRWLSWNIVSGDYL